MGDAIGQRGDTEPMSKKSRKMVGYDSIEEHELAEGPAPSSHTDLPDPSGGPLRTPAESLPPGLRELIRRGEARGPAGPNDPDLYPRLDRALKNVTAAALLDQERGTRCGDGRSSAGNRAALSR